MKYAKLILPAVALLIGLCPASFAQDVTKEVSEVLKKEIKEPKLDTNVTSFPTQAVASELTEEEQAEAAKLRKEAVAIYNEILSYNTQSKAKTVNKNLEFITKALADAEKRLETEVAAYKELGESIYEKGKRIKAMKVSEELKSKKLIELKESYEQRQDSMTYTIKNLKERIEVLKKRQASYKYEKTDLDALNAEAGKKKPMTWAEKDQVKKKEALDTLDKIEDELINKQYEELLK